MSKLPKTFGCRAVLSIHDPKVQRVNMNTILFSHVIEAAHKVKAIVERDSGGRFEVIQIVAPYGYVWNDGGSKHLKLELTSTSRQHRQDVFCDAMTRIAIGVRPMTEQERFEADEPLAITPLNPAPLKQNPTLCPLWVNFIGRAMRELHDKDFGCQYPGLLGKGDAAIFLRHKFEELYRELSMTKPVSWKH